MTISVHFMHCKQFFYDLQSCISCGTRGRRDIFIRDIRRSGQWFPERGLQFGASDLQVCRSGFAWQVQHFVWPGLPLSWQAQRYWMKNRKAIGTRPFALHTTFHAVVFDVDNQNWGNLAELLLFDVRKFRNWGVSHWICHLPLFKEVWQNSFLQKDGRTDGRRTDGPTDRQTDRPTDRQID